MSIVVIDPGHGGTQEVGGSSPNNATGPGGTLEKNLTLEISLKLKDVLAKKHTVFLTRSDDRNLGLAERAGVAKNNNADAFVSIHFNGNDSATVQGTETWVHATAGNPSKLLASGILDRLIVVTKYRDRGVWAKNLGVLKPASHLSKTAAALVEISFITDPKDETRLKSSDYQNQLAESIAMGIYDYLDEKARLRNVQVVPSRSVAADDIGEDI
jgi:N-acetylmuramoyl-L-alanine amidase